MNTINQVCAFMENKPGELAKILKQLSDNDINLRALNIAETADYGVLRFICNDASKAAKVLNENGFLASKAEVMAIKVDDAPGGLEALLGMLAESGVDIAYMYSVFSFAKGGAYMVIHPKDMAALNACAAKNGIQAASADELGIK